MKLRAQIERRKGARCYVSARLFSGHAEMTTYQMKLDGLVRYVESKRINLRKFHGAYSACFADENADAGFSPAGVDHSGRIHEKQSGPPLHQAPRSAASAG